MVVLNPSVPGTKLLPIGEDLPQDYGYSRRVISLSGEWQLTAEKSTKTIPVQVPGVWQDQGLGMDFHGVAKYHKQFICPEFKHGQRVWLHFENVVTNAEVKLNGQLITTHLGAWTSFENDITDFLHPVNILEVKVDEMPQHFTFGFIHFVSAKFGGIWGDVWLELRPEAFIHDLFVTTNISRGTVQVNLELYDFSKLAEDIEIIVCISGVKDKQVSGKKQIKIATVRDQITPSLFPLFPGRENVGVLSIEVPLTAMKMWDTDNPYLYLVDVSILNPRGTVLDRVTDKFGLREFKCEGHKLKLNGNPIYFASILHWAIYQQYLTPSCTKEEFRREIRHLKSCGFNAVNVCLFMFPKRFYEVADEEGILLWQEYPFWSNFTNAPRPTTAEEKDQLVIEYGEMYKKDRKYCSVVLRSFACEDPQPDKELNERLFSLCHKIIPNAVVQDNTGFFNQNFADFISFHPYMETNVTKLALREWMATAQKMADIPLLFGEGMDCDTFRDIPGILKKYGDTRSWWTIEKYGNTMLNPGNFWVFEQITNNLIKEIGLSGHEYIIRNSYHHSYIIRKYQVEQARLYDHFVGNCITGIRDNPITRCGIYNDIDNLKWKPEEIEKWNTPILLIADFARQSRCYYVNDLVKFDVYVSHYGTADITTGTLSVELTHTALSIGVNLSVRQDEVGNGSHRISQREFTVTDIKKGTVPLLANCEFTVPELKIPTEFYFIVKLQTSSQRYTNSWPVWIFPNHSIPSLRNKFGDRPISSPQRREGEGEVRQQWGEEVKDGDRSLIKLYDPAGTLANLRRDILQTGTELMIASVLDDTVKKYLDTAGKVILIDPAGTSFPSHECTFWREVAIERYLDEVFDKFPWEGSVDIQFFDITPPSWSVKAYDLNPSHQPLFRTINCRHLQQNDMIISTNLGTGTVIATTLTLFGENNPAGEFLLQNLVNLLNK